MTPMISHQHFNKKPHDSTSVKGREIELTTFPAKRTVKKAEQEPKGHHPFSPEARYKIENYIQDVFAYAKLREEEDFPEHVQSGRAFTAKKFQDEHPELGLSLHQDYVLPEGLNKEQFHEMIFTDLPFMTSEHPQDAQDTQNAIACVSHIFDQICYDNLECDILKSEFYNDSKHHYLDKVDILRGIASGYAPRDIMRYRERLAIAMEKEEPLAETKLHQACLERYGQLNFVPSDETCRKILWANARLKHNKNAVAAAPKKAEEHHDVSAPLQESALTFDQENIPLIVYTRKAKERGQEDFGSRFQTGEIFPAKYFAEQHPELNLTLHQDYKMPFGLTKEQFHEMIFKDIPADIAFCGQEIKNSSGLMSEIFAELCADNNSCLDLIEAFEADVERREGRQLDILCGIASGYLADDILQYIERIDNIFSGKVRVLDADTAIQKECSKTYAHRLGYVASDKTCEKIIARYKELLHETVPDEEKNEG